MIQDIGRHRLLNLFRPEASPSSGSPVFLFRGRELAIRGDGEEFQLPARGAFGDGGPFYYLFTLDGVDCFLAAGGQELPEGFTFTDVRQLRKLGFGPRQRIFAAFTALQLASWYRDNVFCGTCGSRTRPGTEERSLICTKCGRTIYPRIIPAVIVGVTDGDRLLLTKYARSRGVSYYALVAGFTEIGETFEETVRREVMEEVGLRVKNIRYFASQPWGIADDILAGFYCDVDGDPTIRLDTSELREGVWVPREEITGQPDDFSLTHHMMMVFRDGNEPR